MRLIGPTTLGPQGQTLTVATRVCLHPALVSRIGQRCTTILSEKQGRSQQGDYLPVNVKTGALPLFT